MKSRNKKAQIAGQIFIFVLAAFLAALILIYGYKAIGGFTKRTEQIALIRFETDLSNTIKTISSDFGSVKKLELNVPSKYQKVCLIDLNKSVPTQYDPFCRSNPIICDAWTDKTQNVFLVPMAETTFPILILEIADPGHICPPVRQGKITLRLEGLGDRTKVDEWT